MSDFWPIIDRTIEQSGGDMDLQLKLLSDELERLDDADLISFLKGYEAAHEQAYSWKLWGAASLINAGATDDGFAYFRDWLISRGKATYDAAVADPESLAGKAPPYEAEFELFRYVAISLYQARTGTEAPISFDPVGEPAGIGPAGFGFEEGDLVTAYPKLAAWVATAG